jgi:tetratricopeptide (TPR) repeat protein
LQARAGAGADELADDVLHAWRLFDAGDTNAALAEYKSRLRKEQIDVWQSYFQEQIRLLQEWPATLTNSQLAFEAAKEHYLKRMEAPADLFGALAVLTPALPHIKSAQEAIPVYQLIFNCLSGLGDDSGREAWQDKFLSEYKSDPEVAAMVYLERGQKAFDRKDLITSEALFRKVSGDYPTTSVYADALYGLGVVLQTEQKYDAAVAEYARIFTCKLNENLLDLESSEDYPNYKHKAAIRISECYEATKDPARALEYALMARDRYKFVSYCKDCMFKTRQNIDKRVRQLQEAVKKPSATATVQ